MKTCLKLCLLICLFTFDLYAEEKPPESVVPVEGITFAVNPGRIYLPAEEAAELLGWKLDLDESKKKISLNGTSFNYWSLRRLIGGPVLFNVANLKTAGAEATKDEESGWITLTTETKEVVLSPGRKKVFVDLEAQQMKAWEGERLVLDCHISSGRYGNTPSGTFRTGPYKSRYHYSSRYHNAPMPYSVQFRGNFFFHGFSHVPNYPASKGCIRMHLDKGNPARFFYEWVDRGVPVQIVKKTPKEEIEMVEAPATQPAG
ncbi:MAG: L,D-transpeptidase [Verrucomicrobiales bacterium]|nr:L,D-transpeptidase [Verrucomicrobiales bacterium]